MQYFLTKSLLHQTYRYENKGNVWCLIKVFQLVKRSTWRTLRTIRMLIVWLKRVKSFFISTADRFQYDPRSSFFFRDLQTEYMSPSNTEASKHTRKDLATVDLANNHRSQETGGTPGGPQGNRSAFRAVHQGKSSLAPTFKGAWLT